MKTPKLSLALVLSTVLLDMTALGVIIPILPKLLEEVSHQSLSISSIYGGLLMFLYSFIQFLSLPVLGRISDHTGRRLLLLLSVFGLGVDFLISAWAPNLGWLFFARIFAGLMGSGYSVAAAYIADLSSEKDLGRNFGFSGAALGLGFVIGPLIGGFFGTWGTRTPFLAAAGLSFLNFIFCFFLLPESLPVERRRPLQWKNLNPFVPLSHFFFSKQTRILAWVHFFLCLSDQSFFSIWTYWGMERFNWNARAIGMALAYFGAMAILYQGILYKPISRFLSLQKILIYGLVLNIVSCALFAFANQGWMAYVLSTVLEAGVLSRIALMNYLSVIFPSNQQGELQGSMTSVASLCSVLGPPIMTGLFFSATFAPQTFYFPGAPFLLSSFFVMCAYGLIQVLFRQKTAIST